MMPLLAMPPGREEEARAFYAGALGIAEVKKPANLVKRGGCWFESGALKMSIKATITGGPSSGKTESFERYPVKCPDSILHDLMLPPKP